MPHDLISRRLRNLLADYLSANSVLREIEDEFESSGIPYVPTEDGNFGGQRRTLVHGYYRGVDFSNPSDVRKFLDVLSIFMGALSRQVESDTHGYSPHLRDLLKKFDEQLTREGYKFQNGSIVSISAAARLLDAKAIAATLDASHIADQIQRIEAAIDSDPALAIGTAKELTESCFKTVLDERGIEYTSKDDLLQLGKRVFKTLKLVPDEIPDSAKGAETIKRLLNNLATVVQGLAELRGLYGTGHGRSGRAKGVSARHARLAVAAAGALVTFVFQTHLESSAPPKI